MKTPHELLNDLAMHGGAIVCTSACSEMEIAFARADGRMAAEDSIGFIRRTQEWLDINKRREEARPE